MSQITRCPSCGTTFKVVADQLRISEGWVRCGQCKEVFDAAVHLLVAEPVNLLSDMSFDGVRSMKPARASESEPELAWGSTRGRPSTPVAASMEGALRSSVLSHNGGAQASDAVALEAARAGSDGAEAPPPQEMQIPVRAVPPFLTPTVSTDGAVAVPDWRLEPTSHYGWRTRERPVLKTEDEEAPRSAVPLAAEPAARVEAMASSTPELADAVTAQEPIAAVPLEADSGGYELPFAQLRDSEWPDEGEAEKGVYGGELERPLSMSDQQPAGLPKTAAGSGGGLGLLIARSAESTSGVAEDEASSQIRQKEKARLARPETPETEAERELDASAASPEPHFMRSARRKAFWRSPAMRAGMALVFLFLGLALVAQIGLRDRDYWAARFPTLRPVLTALCGPLHCSVMPPRQIAAVVIDSSSFSKGRGDAYQLSVTIKNKADIAVAMPSMELTLTDAQDQPVLRKVLHASEISAPAALAARDEWSGALSLGVSAGAQSVTGYRVLAFYP